MELLSEVLVTSIIVIALLAIFSLSIYSASRNGKTFGCTAFGEGESFCAICPGRGIRCTIKREIGKKFRSSTRD